MNFIDLDAFKQVLKDYDEGESENIFSLRKIVDSDSEDSDVIRQLIEIVSREDHILFKHAILELMFSVKKSANQDLLLSLLFSFFQHEDDDLKLHCIATAGCLTNRRKKAFYDFLQNFGIDLCSLRVKKSIVAFARYLNSNKKY